MKLTLDRGEETKGLMFKKPVYKLIMNLEFTDEEKELIKKHKWGSALDVVADSEVKEIKNNALYNSSWAVNGGQRMLEFEFIENLAWFEKQVIENAKELKGNLAAAVGFTSGGPREVEL